MTAQPEESSAPPDPGEDPAVIYDALPRSHQEQFRSEYDQALDAAHDLARFEQVRTLLRQWRLRAIAYARPGYEEAVQDALEGRVPRRPPRRVVPRPLGPPSVIPLGSSISP
jgi:hypothetical protein